MYNFSDYLKSFFHANPRADSNEKFLVSSYRVFKYEKYSQGVSCSTSASSLMLTYFTILKSNVHPNLNLVQHLYQGKLHIKDLKYRNVMVLANEYAGKKEMAFYLSVESAKVTDDTVSEATAFDLSNSE
nr:unnamed protein product [Callosobruchus analis]